MMFITNAFVPETKAALHEDTTVPSFDGKTKFGKIQRNAMVQIITPENLIKGHGG